MRVFSAANRFGALALSLALLAGCASNDTTPEEEDEFAGVQERELYELARTALDSNRFPIAIERLEALDTRYPFGPHAEQAQLELIYAYYENSNWEEARAAASRFQRSIEILRPMDVRRADLAQRADLDAFDPVRQRNSIAIDRDQMGIHAVKRIFARIRLGQIRIRLKQRRGIGETPVLVAPTGQTDGLKAAQGILARLTQPAPTLGQVQTGKSPVQCALLRVRRH